MYYDPRSGIVVDFHGGIKDAKKRVLRMIGVPELRYREDPVRIIRVVRFAAKLGFEIEPKTRAPLPAMAKLLADVPQSRLFDEMLKLLQTGHARASLQQLKKQGLERGLFPILDAVFDSTRPSSPQREQFIELALSDTDRRVAEGKSVAPSFLLACLLWHDVLDEWKRLMGLGEPSHPALQQATDVVFDARVGGDISGRGKLAADMREIWTMQPRFERRTGNAPLSLVEQPRFRAGFDFLRLRGQVQEIDIALSQWWETFSLADDHERRDMIDAVRQEESSRRHTRGHHHHPERGTSLAGADEGEGGHGGVAPAARKRRRRRKPAGSGAAAPTGGGD
jgi:poly(A) polymerase